jgi:dipeptidyl aminopeptidase/acylaminoacyl peptidase
VRTFSLFLSVAALGALTFSAARPASSSTAAVPRGSIVFTSDRDGDYDIWTMRADGSRLRRLTRNRIEDRCPSWSPTGRWIAFTRRNVYPPDLFVMRADGSGLRRVLKLRGTDSCPMYGQRAQRLGSGLVARRPQARLRPDGGQPAARDLHRERRRLRRAPTHELAPL